MRLLLVCWMLCGVAWADERPNIVLIMCDDMGYSDIGCFGGEIETPHIDSLARDGMLFTQFYNNAKCTTTRASILTGLYPRPTGPLLKPNMVTLGEVLSDAGYHTALSGKWHLGSKSPRRPSDRGFAEYYGLLDGCCNFFDPSIPDPDFKGGRTRWFGHNDQRITEFPDDFYTTDAFTDFAVKIIRENAAVSHGRKPFFLHLCYTAPHYPLHARPAEIDKYRGRYARIGWDELRKRRHAKQIELGLIDPRWKVPVANREMQPWIDAEHHEWQDLRMAVYAAMIDSMDQNIGRLLQALSETGQEKNTVVMFLSDNGGCAETPGGAANTAHVPGPKEYYSHCGPGWAAAQNTPFRRYKQWVHEGGISTPLLVKWPGHVKPGSRSNAVGHIIDLMPTCCEIAQTRYPDERANGTDQKVAKILPVEGRSMLGHLSGAPNGVRRELYWEWSNSRAIRDGRWKLCWDRGKRQWELYDIPADRTETNNLAEQHPDRVKSLSAKWMAWAKRTGVKSVRSRKKNSNRKADVRPKTERRKNRTEPGQSSDAGHVP